MRKIEMHLDLTIATIEKIATFLKANRILECCEQAKANNQKTVRIF